MNILFITGFFPPVNSIATIRVEKLIKYLINDSNISVSIMTPVLKSDENSKNINGSFFQLTKLGSENKKVSKEVSQKSIDNQKMKENNFFALARLFSDAYYERQLESFDLQSIDVVFSTYGPYWCTKMARKIKKKNSNIFWVADFRDPPFRWDTPKILKEYARNFVRKQCRDADLITSVSKGCMKQLYLLDNQNRMILTNGFDAEDFPKERNSNRIDNKFVILYTGTIYIGREDSTVFFKALKDLIDECFITENEVVLKYAGSYFDLLKNQAQKYNLEGILKNFGFISRLDCLKMQQESDLLLLLSWNKTGEHGVLTGKLFEYMASGKPVVAIVDGNENNSELKSIIENTQIGYCYEEANSREDYILLKQYLKKQIDNFRKNKSVIYEPNSNEVEKFNYNNLAQQLMNGIQEGLKR